MTSSAQTFPDVDVGTASLPDQELHHMLAVARQRPGLAPTTLLGMPARLVVRHDEVRTLLLDDEQFPGAPTYQVQLEPVVGSTFISMDGEEHHRYRRLATPAFRSRRVRRFVETGLEPLAHELLDEFVADGGGDLVERYARVLPFRVISRKLGLPQASERDQRRLSLQMLSYPANPEVALDAAHRVGELVRDVIAEAHGRPGDEDVVAGLVQATDDGASMDDEEVASHIRLLYAVGATTTSDGLSNLLHHVVTRPELLERAAAEPELVPRIVHEVLRAEPPVALLPRLAAHGGELGGQQVEPGTLLLAALAGANRDPGLVGDDPDRFDVDREPAKILTFGMGTKFCPGASLGRLQLEAALRALVERVTDVEPMRSTGPANAILRSTASVEATWRPRRHE